MDINLETLLSTATIPSVTGLGCITAYVFSEQKGIKSSDKFLRKFFPRKSNAFYFRLDFFISAIIGTCIGLILYSPTTMYQALAAGVGWTAAFNIVKSETRHQMGEAAANDKAKPQDPT